LTWQANRNEWYAKAFSRVVPCYEEIESLSGTISCAGFYRLLEKGGSGGDTGQLHITHSDLIADVELVLKHVLQKFNLEGIVLQELPKETQLKIGKEFIKRHIYPLHAYLKPGMVKSDV